MNQTTVAIVPSIQTLAAVRRRYQLELDDLKRRNQAPHRQFLLRSWIANIDEELASLRSSH